MQMRNSVDLLIMKRIRVLNRVEEEDPKPQHVARLVSQTDSYERECLSSLVTVETVGQGKTKAGKEKRGRFVYSGKLVNREPFLTEWMEFMKKGKEEDGEEEEEEEEEEEKKKKKRKKKKTESEGGENSTIESENEDPLWEIKKKKAPSTRARRSDSLTREVRKRVVHS
jgi:hypothetical protein